MTPVGPLLGFHHLTLAVTDLPSAKADWEALLGWPSASGSAVFELADAYVELVAANGGPTGVVEVGVVVDDVTTLTAQLEAAGATVQHQPGGFVAVDRECINGVPLQLRPPDTEPRPVATGPFGRINHVVVAVADYSATLARWASYFGDPPAESDSRVEVSVHVPVGSGWFGITAAGTNARALERFIARAGEGVYSVGLTVDDRPRTLGDLQSRGARLIGDDSTPQTFVHPATTHGLLLDIVGLS
jgi:catechol 2,3-dioxygenase-like lactoylglutathione lyase family enzyme